MKVSLSRKRSEPPKDKEVEQPVEVVDLEQQHEPVDLTKRKLKYHCDTQKLIACDYGNCQGKASENKQQYLYSCAKLNGDDICILCLANEKDNPEITCVKCNKVIGAFCATPDDDEKCSISLFTM